MGEKKKICFLNWEESAKSDPEEMGGKGYNLGRLHRYGFPVPAGGILTSRAYRDFLQCNRLEESINAASGIGAEAVNDPANEKILEEIRRKIIAGQIPGIIRQELAENLSGVKLPDKPVAVRSSATAEDSAIKGSQMREMAKYIYLKPFEPTRLLFQEIGRRLVKRRILIEQADVYHCAMPELVSILSGYWDGSGLKIMVEERKQLKEELSHLDPPDVIIDEVRG